MGMGSPVKTREASGFATKARGLQNSEGTFPDCLESQEEKLASRGERHCKAEYRMDLLVFAVQSEWSCSH